MALDKQIYIYSMDTEDFYTDQEMYYHKKMIHYGMYKSKFKKLREKEFDSWDKNKQKKFNKIDKIISQRKSYWKDLLKKEFLVNTAPRQLREDNLVDKKIISVFESSLTRINKMEINELSTDIMVVETYFYEVIEQLIKNGFICKGDKYKYFTSSAGQIRVKKAVFIKQSIWDKCEKTLMCGLTIEKINEKGGINVNKFLAYLALSNSATDLWDDFNIDRCIVVNDFETNVFGQVDYIDDKTYEITRTKMNVPVTHSDGCGMILPKLSKKNFMVRLPWVKGLLASFDFVKFIKEKDSSPLVKDIYGKEWDVLKDNIQVIFTESQFKMCKYYTDWNEYKKYFKEYSCQAGICKMEDDNFSQATINYQMIQTITDITDTERNNILNSSKNRLYNLSRDKTTMLKAFGVGRFFSNKSYLQQALEIYPELLQDEYCKSTLREIKNSLLKKYRSGKLSVSGKYTFLIPDLYAFCEWLFCGIDKPSGLLDNGQVFCKLFKQAKELDCLRSPHLYAEHAIRENILDDEKKKWFKTDAIYTSSHDLISKILQFDNDGDQSLVVSDEVFLEVVKRNIKEYDVVPLYYEMKKANPVNLDSNSIWGGLNAAFSGGNIGIYSNNISKIWNSDVFYNGTQEEKKRALNLIKMLCMENNFIIDYAKTLYKPKRPKNINGEINSYINKKLPHFFMYAKDKKKSQIENVGLGFVDSFENEFKNKPLRFTIKNFGYLNYELLMHNSRIKIDTNVIDTYKELNKTYKYKLAEIKDEKSTYFLSTIEKTLLSTGYSKIEITDMLIKHLYFKNKTPHKEILWKCFGDVIVKNLHNNIPKDSTQCVKCGNRFIPNSPNQKYCTDCINDNPYYSPIGTKIIKCIDCGKDVEVDAKDNKTCRCEECTLIYRRNYQKELMRKRRLK